MRFLAIDQALASHSYYAATAPRTTRHAPLRGSADTDVAIVGGGLAGLSAAIELADRGHAVTLLEARELGWGASGRNGGQLIAGLASEQGPIEAQLGDEDARAVFAMTLEALDIVRERCARFGIACDLRRGFLSVAVNERKARALRRWHEDMATRYGHATQWLGPAELPRFVASPRFHSGVFDPSGGHLHPLKYTLGLARAAAGLGVRLHEQSPVQSLDTGGARLALRTPEGELRAQRVVLAGNVYLEGVAPALEARIMPVGTYMVATRAIDPALAASLIPSGAAVSDTNVVLDYFRFSADHRLLFGGGISYSTRTPRNLVEHMRRRIAATFPALRDTPVEFTWGGFVDISMNRAPDFGRLRDVAGGPAKLADVYHLQGFSGHGLALTGLAGRLVAEAIDGDTGRFDTFARLRHRAFPGGRWLRMPALVAGMAYHRLRDLL